MRGLSPTQTALVVKTTAGIPVPEARRPFLINLEKLLPARGKCTDEQLIAAINEAIDNLDPYPMDEQGVIPDITENTSLKEAAAIWQRTCPLPLAWWPPRPDLPTRANAAELMAQPLSESFKSLTPEQMSDMYWRTLFDSDEEWEEHKRVRANEEAERLASRAHWPVDSHPPPQVPEIRGEVIPEPEPPPDDPDDDDPRPPRDPAPTRSQAIREAIDLVKRRGRRGKGPPKVFFDR